jgi:hypothetical protein
MDAQAPGSGFKSHTFQQRSIRSTEYVSGAATVSRTYVSSLMLLRNARTAIHSRGKAVKDNASFPA